MKKGKKIGIVFLSIITIFAILFIAPKPRYDGDNPWLAANNNDQALVIAHGGARGVFPGNTKSAFQYSYDLGVDVLEMDVHLTSDDILVTRHGENNTGNIRQMSNCDTVIWNESYDYLYDNCNFGYNFEQDGSYPYREMSQEEWVAAGVYMTTLEELLVSYGDTIKYIIEIKADQDAPRTHAADILVALIEEYDVKEQVIVATSFEDISDYITNTYPSIIQSTSHDDAQSMILSSYSFTSSFFKPENNIALQLPTFFELPVINKLNLSTKLLINTAHRHNMAVHYWTINDPEEMKRLLDLGCDGIITDYPEVLMEVMASYEE